MTAGAAGKRNDPGRVAQMFEPAGDLLALRPQAARA